MNFAALADDGVRVVSVDGVVRLVDDDVLRVLRLVGIKNRFDVRSYHWCASLLIVVACVLLKYKSILQKSSKFTLTQSVLES